MKLFTFCESHYNITIKNPLQFQLVVAYLASGLSFRQVESVFNKTKKLTANAQLGTISDTTVANYARLVCAPGLAIGRDIPTSRPDPDPTFEPPGRDRSGKAVLWSGSVSA